VTELNPRTLAGHSAAMTEIEFSPDSSTLASASDDTSVQIYDSSSGALLQMLRSHRSGIRFVRFSNDSQVILSCDWGNATKIWDVPTGSMVATIGGHSAIISDAVFSFDGRYIATCSEDTTIILWDMASKATIRRFNEHSGSVNSVAFSNDSELILSCLDDATVRMWSLDGVSVGILKSDMYSVLSIAVSADNTLLAYSSHETVRIWNRATKSEQGVLHPGAIVRKMSFSQCRSFLETDRGVLDIQEFGPSSLKSSSRSHAVFATQDWITRDAEKVLWIPEEYRATAVATCGDCIILGHSSGSVSFIFFSPQS
jgi:WD40 repeat protein